MTIHRFISLFLSVLGIISCIIAGIYTFAYLNSIINPTPTPTPKPPDTIYVPFQHPTKTDTVPPKIIEIPKIVRIYLPDTNFRKEKEKDTILTGVKIEGNRVEITKIDTKGVTYLETYKIDPDMKGMFIDHRGHFGQKKRTKLGRFLRKAKWYAIGTVAAAGAITVAIILK